jgi:N-glycosidase YbiA
MTIKFYKIADPHGHMSNFKKAPMTIYGRTWNNVEAPYQAQKTKDPAEYNQIWEAKSAREARELGQNVSIRDDWDTARVSVMKECVLAKYTQHADLREQLLETGDEELIEDSPVDSFWGCGSDGAGKNMLGKILMEVRDELRNKNN